MERLFIDLVDVGCEGVTGFMWLRVEFVMNMEINMNEVKCFFSLCGGGEGVKHREALRCFFRIG
jgi:hypothetical protein